MHVLGARPSRSSWRCTTRSFLRSCPDHTTRVSQNTAFPIDMEAFSAYRATKESGKDKTTSMPEVPVAQKLSRSKASNKIKSAECFDFERKNYFFETRHTNMFDPISTFQHCVKTLFPSSHPAVYAHPSLDPKPWRQKTKPNQTKQIKAGHGVAPPLRPNVHGGERVRRPAQSGRQIHGYATPAGRSIPLWLLTHLRRGLRGRVSFFLRLHGGWHFFPIFL